MKYSNEYFVKINKEFIDTPKENPLLLFMGAGNTANNHLIKGAKYELRDTNIQIVDGSFNRYMEELLFNDDEYDIIHIHESSIQLYLSNDFDYAINTYLENITKIIHKHTKSLIIINTLEYLPFRFFGNTALTEEEGLIYKINKANEYLVSLVSEKVKINDMNYVANYLGLKNYFDEKVIFNFSYGSSMEGQYYAILNLCNIIKSWIGRTKKGIITDLDNTFWSGVIGDDGLEEIKQRLNTRKNSNFKIYHKMLEELKNVGVFLGVASKNNEEVSNVFSEFNIPEKFFSVKKINWNMKSANISEISQLWNISVNDIVFIDDNSREIAEVTRAFGDDYEALLFESSMQQLSDLQWYGWFEKIAITKTDKQRNENFIKMQEFQSEGNNMDLDSFIKSLQIELTFDEMNDNNMERIIQLLNKTNQFNNRKTIFTQKKLEDLLADGYKVCGVSYKDKLGEEGIISVIIYNSGSDKVVIENWVMSCRVFKRDVEYSILDYVLGDKRGYLEYKISEKNKYFIDFVLSDRGQANLDIKEVK